MADGPGRAARSLRRRRRPHGADDPHRPGSAAPGYGGPRPRMSAEARTPDRELVLASARQELARLPALLDTLLGGLDPADWGARPAPTEWSPVEIVCHLRDEEVEDFGA